MMRFIERRSETVLIQQQQLHPGSVATVQSDFGSGFRCFAEFVTLQYVKHLAFC
jgi:hypothetical protein